MDGALGPQSIAQLVRLLRDAPRLSVLLIELDAGLLNAVNAPAALAAAALRVSSLTQLRLEVVGL